MLSYSAHRELPQMQSNRSSSFIAIMVYDQQCWARSRFLIHLCLIASLQVLLEHARLDGLLLLLRLVTAALQDDATPKVFNTD
jgi:hypothetical protein